MKRTSIIAAAIALGIAFWGQEVRAQLVQNVITVNNDNNQDYFSASSTSWNDTTTVPTAQTFTLGPSTSPSGGNAQAGLLSESVIAAGADSKNPLGGEVFVVTIQETAADYIDTLVLNGFYLSDVEVGYVSGSAGAQPIYAQLGASGGLTLGFNGLGYQTNPDLSDTIYIYTSATTFAGATANIDNNNVAVGSDVAPVPEASTVMAGALMLLPLGIGAIRAVRKERVA